MDVKLSVVIPCYNMGKYVTDAVNSVLAYPNQDILEIIIVNDGSDDDGFTKSVLDKFQHKNIKVVHQANQGLAMARNNGIALAKADYILPLDADNKIRSTYIEESIAVLDKNLNIGVCYGDLERFGIDNRIVNVGDFDISKLIVKNYIDACVVLRKEAFESVNGYDKNMPVMGYEDWDINLRLFFKGWQFYHINEVCFDYRVRENSMLSNSNVHRKVLVEYMFKKDELYQASLLRKNILDYSFYKDELSSMKNRKVIKIALNIEKKLKSIINQFK